jgi:hypothetical protein
MSIGDWRLPGGHSMPDAIRQSRIEARPLTRGESPIANQDGDRQSPISNHQSSTNQKSQITNHQCSEARGLQPEA